MSKFTVGELRALLDGIDDDAEVRMVHQPSWPLEYSLGKLRYRSPVQDDIEKTQEFIRTLERKLMLEAPLSPDEEADLEGARAALKEWEETPKILYLVEGSYIGYGSADLWDGED